MLGCKSTGKFPNREEALRTDLASHRGSSQGSDLVHKSTWALGQVRENTWYIDSNLVVAAKVFGKKATGQ